MEKVNLNISVSKDCYESLVKLAKEFQLDVNRCVSTLIDVLALYAGGLVNSRKQFKVPADLEMVLANILSLGEEMLRLCNTLLDAVEGAGFFT